MNGICHRLQRKRKLFQNIVLTFSKVPAAEQTQASGVAADVAGHDIS